VFSTDDRSLQAVVGDALRQRGWRVGVAESCTAGLLMARLTEVPGSSAWVAGGVVAYANDLKIELLGVPAEMIATHGAVSEPVALAMASGVRDRLGSEVGVGVTGIAGPGGGTTDKPVGTVAIAVKAPGHELVKTFRFPGDRQDVRTRSVAGALDLIRRMLT
jgi:nicotinamide-nucleotide amidase